MDPASSAPLPARWVSGAKRSLLDTRILSVLGAEFRHPARPEGREFIVIQAPDWVNVLALTPDHKLVMVNQFRYGINTHSWEIPGGVMEPGEDPITAGLRELAEETGYVGTRARLLGQVHPNPAIQNNTCHLVLVEDALPRQALDWDADEELAVAAWPVAEVMARAYAGQITHALVLNGLFLFAPVWEKLRQTPPLAE